MRYISHPYVVCVCYYYLLSGRIGYNTALIPPMCNVCLKLNINQSEMDKYVLVVTIAFVLLGISLEVCGGKGKFKLVSCKKSCIKNCTASSKPTCKLGCIRDCANQAWEESRDIDESRIPVGDEGSRRICKRTCKKECARKPPICTGRCMQNCTRHRHGNDTVAELFNRGKRERKLNGLRVPAFCTKQCVTSCSETIACKRDCLDRCESESSARIYKCKKRCRTGLECVFSACTTCKASCFNTLSECRRTKCEDLCHPDKEIDIEDQNEEKDRIIVKRFACRRRHKPSKPCRACRATCEREVNIETSAAEIEH